MARPPRARRAPADLVAISGHKFGGPKGVGALVVRDGVAIVPLVEGGGHEGGRRAGTQNVAGIVALATALAATDDARDAEEVARIARAARPAAARARATVAGSRSPATRPAGRRRLHVASPGVEAETLLVALDQRGVYAASGSACSSGAVDPSHVLLAMGMDRERALSCVRFSLGYASTDADVDGRSRVIPAAVAKLVASVRVPT